MSHMGPMAGAAFSSVKLMERFAFLPAIAFAQVITFLVSMTRLVVVNGKIFMQI